jgi:hypothetical protein
MIHVRVNLVEIPWLHGHGCDELELSCSERQPLPNFGRPIL